MQGEYSLHVWSDRTDRFPDMRGKTLASDKIAKISD